MVLLLNLVKVLVLTSLTSAFFVNLRKLGNVLEKKYNLDFLKDYLKFPVYIDPHPSCALADEECTLDSNCCGGLECKMTVDREGLKYTCQEKVGGEDNGTVTMTEEREEEEWGQNFQESDNSNSLLQEIYRTKLEELNSEEDKLINDQYYMIKELQKPLSFEEMRELQQAKEIDDYKRENELQKLRQWAKTKKALEEQKRETENKMKDLAVERVSKVLKEEEKQKLAMFKEIQQQFNKKKSWF